MGFLGDTWDMVKHVGADAAHVVESGAKDLKNIATGAVLGGLAGGPAGALVGGFMGAQEGDAPPNPAVGGLAPGDLVQRVLHGPGTSSLQETYQVGIDQAAAQQQIESGSRDLMAGLESTWTGGASDAARASIQPLADTAASASATLQRNSSLAQDQISQFESMKNSLHPDVTNTPPEKSFWDSATPWNTSTEDAINDHNQKAQENQARYTDYSSQSTANTGARTIDYGQLAQAQTPDFKLATTPPSPPSLGHDPGTGGGGSHRATGGNNSPSFGGNDHENQPPPPAPPIHQPAPGEPAGSNGGYLPSGGTSAAGYTPLPTTGGFQPGGFGPGTGGGDSTYSPGGSASGSAGFGPIGGGFGGSSGGFGGSGSGGSGSGGSGAGGSGAGRGLAGGRSSGAGVPSESTGRAGGASSSGSPATAGKPGASGMGAGGKGKGEGSEDTEHARPSYLLEPDPHEIFGTDERTVPPVIGL